ncbi:MAG: undecaprenyl/decaprenyl-phosphate alpha-N-acetylglucosaminyl 1-phosphate transferase [Fimbriimonadaceae bacterium]|nr:undecaprenyl/decaprenyl-phosphate alpha-N-acetylglucosaminyl 1-phosphate transferase [Fimbriimonadaceae bacterium]
MLPFAELPSVAPDEFLQGFRYPLMAGVVALVATLVLTPLVRKLAFRAGAVDDPKRDDRRVHTEPVPRWGGMAIFGGILVALLAVLPFAYPYAPFPPYLIGMLVLGTAIVGFGAYDDLKQYSAKLQLLVLLGVGIGVQFFFSDIGRVQIAGMNWPPIGGLEWMDFGWAAIPLTAIYIFVVTKTMDTIDGVDGLAAGIASIAAGTIAVIAKYEGQPRVALIAAAIAGACVGFLRYNYNPAKIFMGTGGAQLLGFFLACLSVVGALKTAAALALFIPILIFGVPIVDAIVVTIRRIIARQPITQADKRHLHHQLLAKGLTQRQTVVVLYGFAILLAGVLLLMVKYGN